ncbi:hypothetical protein OROMI_001824 [Orobanche minor]
MEQERLRHQELVQHQIKYATKNGIQIIQPHIQRSRDRCSFASVSKQLDYQLRLIYARAEVPTTLPLPPNRCLINHLKWQQELMDLTQCDASRRFSPKELLTDAKTRGAPLWNGRRHVIDDMASYAPVPGSYVDAHTIKRLYPLVGVIAVKEDFSNDGKDIYEGKMKGVPDDYIKSDGQRQEEATHAVVFLDTHDINHVIDIGEAVLMTYVAYQNSDRDANNSMCPMGVSWLLPNQVVKELHFRASLPPLHPSPPLQSPQQIYNHSVELHIGYSCLQCQSNNQAEAKVALFAALLNVQAARKLLKDLGRCHIVYENVSATAQIPISETAKKVNDVHISGEEIQLHCLKLEKELNIRQLLIDTSY